MTSAFDAESVSCSPRKVEEPDKTRGRSNALKQRETWQERQPQMRNLHMHISNAVAGLLWKPTQQNKAPLLRPGRMV